MHAATEKKKKTATTTKKIVTVKINMKMHKIFVPWMDGWLAIRLNGSGDYPHFLFCSLIDFGWSSSSSLDEKKMGGRISYHYKIMCSLDLFILDDDFFSYKLSLNYSSGSELCM